MFTYLELFVGRLATLLFQAVVRSAASASRKLAGGRNMGVSKLLAYLPRESSIENDKIPLRFNLLSLAFVKLKHVVALLFQTKMVDRSDTFFL